jgi:uncharacterized membrane protein
MLNRLLGIDSKDVLQVLDLHFRRGWPAAGLIVLLALAAAYAIVMYRRERTVSAVARAGMAACRVLSLGIILFVLFQPVLSVAITTSIPAHVIVVVDGSDSMTIRDTRKDPDQLIDAALALGRLAYDQPDRQRAVFAAGASMQAAAAAIREGRLNDTREAQDQAVAALAGIQQTVKAAATQPTTTGAATNPALEALDALLKQQLKVKVSELAAAPTPEARQAMADAQLAVAADLAAWERSVEDSHLPLSEKLRTDMAQVSRHEMAVGLLTTSDLGLSGSSAGDFSVQYYRFGGNLEPIGGPANLKQALAPLSSEPESTNLGGAIEQAVDRHSGQPIAGVVVVTDGASNLGPDPMEVARRMKERAIPLYTIGVGLPKPDDVYVRGLVVQDVVFANDLVPLRVQVFSSGYEKRLTTLSVSLDGTEMASKQIMLTGKPQFEELTFRASRTSGTKKLEVAVAPMPNEATIENNKIERSLRVSDQKIKVLCIEGSPRWEYRYLRAVLKRDPRIEAQFITTEGDRELARASKEHLARFPEKPEQAFGYDLVILGDVRATTFTPGQLQRIEELVRERGGSLIMLAGHKHAPAEYVDTPIGQMLPVWPEQGKWEEVSKDAYPVLTPEGQASTVMQLDPSESKNRALWANVKPLNEVPSLGGAKPGAHVLAELSDTMQHTPLPLIAWHRYGAGKVMFVGTDRLFRLRIKTGDEYHARFWGQVIQFLTLSRLLGENQRIRLEVDHVEGRAGEPTQIYANVLNETYEPAAAPAWPVVIRSLDKPDTEQALVLQPVPNMHGLFHGIFVPREAGRYQLAAAEQDKALANSVEFSVSTAAAEQADAAMHQDLLRNMADISGGRYLTVRDLPVLTDLLHGKRRNITLHRDIELWDSWLWPVLFMAFAGLEWGWRRKRDLA